MSALSDNPRRPPRKWWNDCVRGVKRSGTAADPQSVCGALWYRKMSSSQRRAATSRSEKRCDLCENPRQESASLWIVGGLAAIAGGLLVMLSREAKAKAATATTTPALPGTSTSGYFAEPQSFELSPGRSRSFTAALRAGQLVEVEFSSTQPLDVFFVDSAQLAAMQGGSDFAFRGQLALKIGVQSFRVPHDGSWTLIAGNPSQQVAAQVTLTARYA